MALLLTACTDDKEQFNRTDSSITFQLAHRENSTNNTPRYVRLLIAERLSEHENFPGQEKEPLHCSPEQRYDLVKRHYVVTGLLGKWYKFAFFDVPDLMERDMGKKLFVAQESNVDEMEEHRFNQLMINYLPILELQQHLNSTQHLELSIYRKILDRWLYPSNMTLENVSLQRITGDLVLDMGIPEDQFEHPLQDITLHLTGKMDRFFLHDRASDDVILEEKQTTHDFVWTPTSQKAKQKFKVSLLPGTFAEAKLIVTFTDGTPPATFPLTDKANNQIQVKQNVRSLLLFNGMEQNQFEIRYAGFDDHASLDVAPDDWNGWQTDF